MPDVWKMEIISILNFEKSQQISMVLAIGAKHIKRSKSRNKYLRIQHLLLRNIEPSLVSSPELVCPPHCQPIWHLAIRF